MRTEYNRYGVNKGISDAYYATVNAYGEIVYTIKEAYKECGCMKGKNCLCFAFDSDNEKNRYGMVISKSDNYWLDCTGYHKRYVLKRGYKECGCEKGVDCDCDDECFEGWYDKPVPEDNSRRRLLLLTRK